MLASTLLTVGLPHLQPTPVLLGAFHDTGCKVHAESQYFTRAVDAGHCFNGADRFADIYKPGNESFKIMADVSTDEHKLYKVMYKSSDCSGMYYKRVPEGLCVPFDPSARGTTNPANAWGPLLPEPTPGQKLGQFLTWKATGGLPPVSAGADKDYIKEAAPPVGVVDMQKFDGCTITNDADTYTFSSGAEGYCGWANTDSSVYPFVFAEDGKVTFKGSVPSGGDVNVRFRFEYRLYPDVDPAYDTASVTVSGATLSEYEVSVPSQGSKTFSSFVMYVVERDSPVVLKDITVFHSGGSLSADAHWDNDQGENFPLGFELGGYIDFFAKPVKGVPAVKFDFVTGLVPEPQETSYESFDGTFSTAWVNITKQDRYRIEIPTVYGPGYPTKDPPYYRYRAFASLKMYIKDEGTGARISRAKVVAYGATEEVPLPEGIVLRPPRKCYGLAGQEDGFTEFLDTTMATRAPIRAKKAQCATSNTLDDNLDNVWRWIHVREIFYAVFGEWPQRKRDQINMCGLGTYGMEWFKRYAAGKFDEAAFFMKQAVYWGDRARESYCLQNKLSDIYKGQCAVWSMKTTLPEVLLAATVDAAHAHASNCSDALETGYDPKVFDKDLAAIWDKINLGLKDGLISYDSKDIMNLVYDAYGDAEDSELEHWQDLLLRPLDPNPVDVLPGPTINATDVPECTDGTLVRFNWYIRSYPNEGVAVLRNADKSFEKIFATSELEVGDPETKVFCLPSQAYDLILADTYGDGWGNDFLSQETTAHYFRVMYDSTKELIPVTFTSAQGEQFVYKSITSQGKSFFRGPSAVGNNTADFQAEEEHYHTPTGSAGMSFRWGQILRLKFFI